MTYVEDLVREVEEVESSTVDDERAEEAKVWEAEEVEREAEDEVNLEEVELNWNAVETG